MSDEHANDLFWHALNYRGAPALSVGDGRYLAEDCWQELLACHERLVAAAVVAERERCARLCEEQAESLCVDEQSARVWLLAADFVRAASAQHLDTSAAICDNPRT